jgi:hypothetical protein
LMVQQSRDCRCRGELARAWSDSAARARVHGFLRAWVRGSMGAHVRARCGCVRDCGKEGSISGMGRLRLTTVNAWRAKAKNAKKIARETGAECDSILVNVGDLRFGDSTGPQPH